MQNLCSYFRFVMMLQFVFVASLLSAQNFYFKTTGGVFYYQGDLAPKPIDLSFGPGNWTYGFSVGYGFNKWISTHLKFVNGNISGNDANSESYERRSRNLSFRSSLREYGTNIEINVNHFLKSLDKYKLRFYLVTGVNMITFNPQTFYDNKWVYLQPLGTEGQTLPSANKKPYKLQDWSRNTGLNIEFDLTQKLALGIDLSTRKTWTDYLDDVSTTYPDREAMIAAGNTLGATLSDRSGEFLGTGIPARASNTPRGRSDKNDWYSFFGLYLKVTIDRSKPDSMPNDPDKNAPQSDLKNQ